MTDPIPVDLFSSILVLPSKDSLKNKLEAQKGKMDDLHYTMLMDLFDFLDYTTQNRPMLPHPVEKNTLPRRTGGHGLGPAGWKIALTDNVLLTEWVLKILALYVPESPNSQPLNTTLLTLFRLLLSIQDKLLPRRVTWIMSNFIALWKHLAPCQDQESENILVSWINFVDMQIRDSYPSTKNWGKNYTISHQDEESSQTEDEEGECSHVGGSCTSEGSRLFVEGGEDFLIFRQLVTKYLVKKAALWVRPLLLAASEKSRQSGKVLIQRIIKLSSGPGCIVEDKETREIQPLVQFRDIFCNIFMQDPHLEAAGEVIDTLHYTIHKSAKFVSNKKIYNDFLVDLQNFWMHLRIILNATLKKVFGSVSFPSESRQDSKNGEGPTKVAIDHVESMLTNILELLLPISEKECYVNDYSLQENIMKCCLKFGVYRSCMKKEEAQRYDILFSGLIKLCEPSISTPILKRIYEISSSHQDIVMHFLYHYYVHESLLNVMPLTANLTGKIIIPMLRAGHLAEKTIDSFFGWLDPNKDNDIFLKKTRLFNLINLLTSIKGEEEFSDNLCKKLVIWEAMRTQILKLSSQNKNTGSNEGVIFTEKDATKVLETFDRRMRRVATERAAIAQNQLLEMLDNEEREIKSKARRKEQKAKRNKRLKARRRKKREKVQMLEAHKQEEKKATKESSPSETSDPSVKNQESRSTKTETPSVQTQNFDDFIAANVKKKKAVEKVSKSSTKTQTKSSAKVLATAAASPKPQLKVQAATKQQTKTVVVKREQKRRSKKKKEDKKAPLPSQLQSSTSITTGPKPIKTKASTSARSRQPLPTSTPSLKETRLYKTRLRSGLQPATKFQARPSATQTPAPPGVRTRVPMTRRRPSTAQHTSTPTARRHVPMDAPWVTSPNRAPAINKTWSSSSRASYPTTQFVNAPQAYPQQPANIPRSNTYRNPTLPTSSPAFSPVPSLRSKSSQVQVPKLPNGRRKMSQATTPPPAQKVFSSPSKSETHSSSGSQADYVEPINNLQSCYKKPIAHTITTLPTSSLWIPPSYTQQPKQLKPPTTSSQTNPGVFCNRVFSSSVLEGIPGLNSQRDRALEKIPSSNPWNNNSLPTNNYHEDFKPRKPVVKDQNVFENLDPILSNPPPVARSRHQGRINYTVQRPELRNKLNRSASGFNGNESLINQYQYQYQESTPTYLRQPDRRQPPLHAEQQLPKENVPFNKGRQMENYMLQGRELRLTSSRVCQRCLYTLPLEARFCCMCGTRVSESAGVNGSPLSN